MKEENLHLLIHEELYLLPQDRTENPAEQVNKEVENKPEESIRDPKAELNKPTVEETNTTDSQKEPTPTSPTIPDISLEKEAPKKWPLAVFHDSSKAAELELLHKILDACEVQESDYHIFSQGFDRSVKFDKALVFIDKANAFYTPIPYKGSHFLCSRPLAILLENQNEKAQLWGALQKFVL